DEIGRRPSVPLGVLEWSVDRAPGARIVHEQHPGDRHSAENVEREKAFSLRRFSARRRLWCQRLSNVGEIWFADGCGHRTSGLRRTASAVSLRLLTGATGVPRPRKLDFYDTAKVSETSRRFAESRTPMAENQPTAFQSTCAPALDSTPPRCC